MANKYDYTKRSLTNSQYEMFIKDCKQYIKEIKDVKRKSNDKPIHKT